MTDKSLIQEWPTEVGFVCNWPVVTSRLADIGYIDSSGTWRRILNAFDAGQCRRFNIKSLDVEIGVSYAQEKLSDKCFVRVSQGWNYRPLNVEDLRE